MLIPLAVLSLAWFSVTVAHIQLFHQLTLLLILVCWGTIVFGRAAVPTLVAAAATFLLAFPFQGALLPILRSLATVASGAMVRLLGIPAEIQGDVVRIPAGSFVIADGCAGLRFLLAGVIIGAFYAHILVRRWPAQLAVVGLGAVIAIVGNWVRITTVIVAGHLTDMQSGLVESHLGFGWVVFTVGLVPFFLLARSIEKWDARKASGAGTEPGPVESDAATAAERRGEAAGLMKRAGMATAVGVLGPVLYFVIGALPAADAGEMALAELARGEGWYVAEDPKGRPFGWRPAYQGAQQHDSVRFTDGATHVYGDRFVYRKQAQGAKLIGYPNEIAPGEDVLDERVMGPVDPDRRRWVQQAVVRAPEGPVLVWYWYRIGGVDTFSPVHAKVLEVPAFLARRRASELIAFGVACEPDNCADAFQALAGLMGLRTLSIPEDSPG